MKKYAIKEIPNAWFRGWGLFEIYYEGVGYKKYKKIDSFEKNSEAYVRLEKILGRPVDVWDDLE